MCVSPESFQSPYEYHVRWVGVESSRMKSGSGGQLGCVQARVPSKGWYGKAYLRVDQNSVRVDV
jgi:hypothetical protein